MNCSVSCAGKSQTVWWHSFRHRLQTLQVSEGERQPLDARSPQSRDGEHGESEPDWIKENRAWRAR